MTERYIYMTDPDTGRDTDQVLLVEAEADPRMAQKVLDAPVVDQGHNGRSPFMWFRLQNGDLILGVWPKGEVYEETELDPNRP